MNADTIIAMAGLVALGAAAFTGAIWDSPLVSSTARVGRRHQPYGRHAMPLDTPAAARVAARS
jgi:hypothetical protein